MKTLSRTDREILSGMDFNYQVLYVAALFGITFDAAQQFINGV